MRHTRATTSAKMEDNTTTGTTSLKPLLEDVLDVLDVFDVQDASVEGNGAIKTPKSQRAPGPTAPATTPLPPVPDITISPPTPLPELYPILIDGELPSKSTGVLKKLELLPVKHEVILKPKRKLKKSAKRMSYEEGWVGTQRGAIAERPCYECSKGCGPFTMCCVVEGLFNGACANCHYGGNASRCSFYQDRKNAEAHLIAQHEEAPEIPGMLPANYTGGSLTNSNFKLAGSAGTPLLEHVPVPQQATPGVVRGGGGKRIAPTPAPQHGFGQTAISRRAHAMSLTPEQRETIAGEYLEIVRTLREVADEEGDESWGFVVPVGEVQSKKRKRGGEEVEQ